MIYSYYCEECDKVIEEDFPFGKNPQDIRCSCGFNAYRTFGECNFILKGSGWPGKSEKVNKELTDRNKNAGKKSKENNWTPTLQALDYGNGDIREVKKK